MRGGTADGPGPQEAPDRSTLTALAISARGVGRVLAALVGALVVLSVAGQVALRLAAPEVPAWEPVPRRLNLDSEASVPMYVSAILLLTAGGLLALTARVTGVGWRSRWAALGVVFVLLSMDEAMMLHESLVDPVRSALDTSGVFYFAWVIPGAVFVAVVGAAYVPFLLRQPPWLRRQMMAAGALYVGGALGMELVGGALVSAGSAESWAYLATATIEETGELAGVSLFVYALVRHLEWRGTRLSVQFGDAQA